MNLNAKQGVLLLAIVVALTVPASGQQPRKPSLTTEQVGALLQQATSLMQVNRAAEAEPILRRVIAAAPQNADAHNLLGIILDQRQDFKAAENEYRIAIRFNSQAVSPLTNLGVLLGRTGRQREAIQMFETVLQRAPDHKEATLNLGILYRSTGSNDRAVTLLQRAAQSSPPNYDVQLNLGIALLNLRRYDEATNAFQSALNLMPSSADATYYVGMIAWSKNDVDSAANSWDEAVRLRPKFPEAYFMLGEALRKTKRVSASIEFYKQALAQDETKFVYYARLGGTYILLGQAADAVEIFRRGVIRFPRLFVSHYFAAIAARAHGDYQSAERELRSALGIEPTNVNALAQLGFVLLERGDMRTAEITLRRAIKVSDRHFYANYDLGRLLVKASRYEEALPVLKHAATLKQTNPSVHYQLFLALTRLKRKDEAQQEFEVFKQLDEARKSRPRTEVDLEDEDLLNPQPPGLRN